MGQQSPRIGAEELTIFRYVQEHGPVTVREAAEHFAGAGKARTTILTVMERLRAKGLLARKRVGGAFRYSTTIEASSLLQSLVGDFVHKVLGGSLSPLTTYMSQAGEISDDELAELRDLVRDLDRRRQISPSEEQDDATD